MEQKQERIKQLRQLVSKDSMENAYYCFSPKGARCICCHMFDSLINCSTRLAPGNPSDPSLAKNYSVWVIYYAARLHY
jgi:hypothetical protein